jgi:predicted GH43/DUF377 family glycosyl hydrolase
MREDVWYSTKAEILLEKILSEEKYALWYMGDDNDKTLADHVRSRDEISEFVDLSEVMFLGSRSHEEGGMYRFKSALEDNGIPHVVNTPDTMEQGVQGTRSFVRSYLEFKAQKEGAAQPWPYQTNDSLQHLRTLTTEMPQPSVQTIIRPQQDDSLVGKPEKYPQYDLGVPTAVPLEDGRFLVLYKAATGPSQSQGAKESSPSYPFAAIYDPKSSNVRYLNREGEISSQADAGPYFQSSLTEIQSKDGVHDPRATNITIGNKSKTVILACAFNKDEEQKSMKEAAGDMNRPIRGAVTEILMLKDPLDPSSVVVRGQFGPDFHAKNMLFFPETFNIEGKEHLAFLTRKMPSIQMGTIAVEDLKRITSDKQWRDDFWQEHFNSETISNRTILEPIVPFEGKGSPYAAHGQVAPALSPMKVEVDGNDYWLIVYNAVPDSKSGQGGNAVGRVIGAALVEYNDPTQVVARCPHPIILPVTDTEFINEEGSKPRHSNVAFAGGGGINASGQLSVFYTEGDSTIKVAKWDSVKDLTEYILKYDDNGYALGA